ncbi:MAG: DUF3822 family protein [Taibaiella sp.]|nr:DUF3822 family protein [Taibaiella sp.]
MASESKNIYRQVYNTSEDVKILAGIDHVTCVLTRRAMLAAAFNASNELLSVHYSGYSTDRVVWELDFFEHLFTQEPLLMEREKITKVFFCSALCMVVPEDLYEMAAANEWFSKIHFTDSSDAVKHYFLKEDKLNYLYALPKNIEALVKINCINAATAPLAACQFTNNHTRGVRLHCLLTSDQACVSLFHYGTLLWHRVFDYSAAEDIAYEVRLVCEEHKINTEKVTINCNTISATETGILKALAPYFAEVTTGTGHSVNMNWSATLSLIKQLEQCA